MKRSLHGSLTNISKQCGPRRFSTAFDPFHFLHYDTAKRDQSAAFHKVWHNDIGDFKKHLSAEEIQEFEYRVSRSEAFDEFYAKMRELMSPRRHDAIRNTRSWRLTYDQIVQFWNDDDQALTKLVFDDDDTFTAQFKDKYLAENDTHALLRDFELSDLRFMCAVQAIEIYGGPKINAVFGCRNNYHYNIPEPVGHSAHWMSCLYDRNTLYDVVLVTAFSAMKEKKAINQLYFKDKLASLENNALKEEEWREYAQEFANMDTMTFNDKLDRAFVAFQTDAGVSELRPRFNNTDID